MFAYLITFSFFFSDLSYNNHFFKISDIYWVEVSLPGILVHRVSCIMEFCLKWRMPAIKKENYLVTKKNLTAFHYFGTCSKFCPHTHIIGPLFTVQLLWVELLHFILWSQVSLFAFPQNAPYNFSSRCKHVGVYLWKSLGMQTHESMLFYLLCS